MRMKTALAVLIGLCSNALAHAGTNPALSDDFSTDRASCRVFQYEGRTSDGLSCAVNVAFGRNAPGGGEGGGVCISGRVPQGNVRIYDRRRTALAYETLGSAFRYDAGERTLYVNGYDCTILGFYTYPVDGNAQPF